MRSLNNSYQNKFISRGFYSELITIVRLLIKKERLFRPLFLLVRVRQRTGMQNVAHGIFICHYGYKTMIAEYSFGKSLLFLYYFSTSITNTL